MPAVCPSNSYLLPPALITLPSQCLLYSHCANNLTRGTLFGPASTSLVTMSLSLSSHLLPLFISDILLNRPLRRRRNDSRPPGPYPSHYSHRDSAQRVLHPSQLWSRSLLNERNFISAHERHGRVGERHRGGHLVDSSRGGTRRRCRLRQVLRVPVGEARVPPGAPSCRSPGRQSRACACRRPGGSRRVP